MRETAFIVITDVCHIFTVNYHQYYFYNCCFSLFYFHYFLYYYYCIKFKSYSKVNFLNFSYIAVVCINLSNYFLKDRNRNETAELFLLSLPSQHFTVNFILKSVLFKPLFWRSYINFFVRYI